MLEEVVLDNLKMPGVNAPARTKEDSVRELAQVAEKERQVMIGKAFERFLQAGYGGKGDFQGMLASSVVMSDALKLVKIDGKEITPDVSDKIMFDLTSMQLDMLTPNRAEFADLRKSWRKPLDEIAKKSTGFGIEPNLGNLLTKLDRKRNLFPTANATPVPKKNL